jgi:hypothetical protein
MLYVFAAHACRGLEKRGERLLLNSHVDRILLDSSGRATGVALRGGGSIKARKAVVSNASVWDTVRLLPPDLPAAQAAVSTFNRWVTHGLIAAREATCSAVLNGWFVAKVCSGASSCAVCCYSDCGWFTCAYMQCLCCCCCCCCCCFCREAEQTPNCPSFMHLHVGFDKTGAQQNILSCVRRQLQVDPYAV